jgi:hypothetical protein
MFFFVFKLVTKPTRTKYVLSHIINYPDDVNYPDDDDYKNDLNMLVINNMGQNIFCARASVGFVT